MRVFSPSVQRVLDSDVIKYFYLIDLEFSGGSGKNNYYFTSYSSDIFANGKNYVAEGGLFEIDSPSFSTIVDREAYKLSILDFRDEIAAEFKVNVVGKPIKVKLGILDEDNHPLINAEDLIDVYDGYVDSPSVSIDWETKVAHIEGTSPMSDLDSVNPFITSKSGMDQRSKSDTSFDNIFSDSEVEIKWGKD